MSEKLEPFLLNFDRETGLLKPYKTQNLARLSDLKEFYYDKEIVQEMLSRGDDPLIYEAYWFTQRPSAEFFNVGSTIIHPGKVGDEYFHTKGHFHVKEMTSEVYITLKGRGIFMMQTREGRVKYLDLEPNTAVYVYPWWAHRVVNTGKEKLVTLFICPADAGADHCRGSQAFRKLVVEKDEKPKIIGNPIFG